MPRYPTALPALPRIVTTSITTKSSSHARARPLQPTASTMSGAPTNEHLIQRNPHPDFAKVQAERPAFDAAKVLTYSRAPAPDWQFGGGGHDGGASTALPQVEIDPYEDGRPAVFNYKLLISAIIPRPIAFVSTRAADGSSTNLAPFSYFQMINHDPPLFTIGYSCGLDAPKDSLRNLLDARECTINIISEHFVEAANSTSINAPYGSSEWAVSGLTPAPSVTVTPSRVREAVFAIEGKLESAREFESKATPGKKSGVLCVIEGTRFWVREDAINEERNIIDPKVLKPVSRLGGITYGRTTEAYELLRPDFNKSKEKLDELGLDKPKVDGQ